MSAAIEPPRPRATPSMRTLGGAVLLVAAVAACVVTASILRSSTDFALVRGPVAALIDCVAAISLVVAGAVAAARRRPFALIVVSLGGTWAVREWANPAAPTAFVFSLGLLLGAVWVPLAGWLALGYPCRKPLGRHDRLVVGVGFVATLLPAASRAATFDPARNGCTDCPANLLLMSAAPPVAMVASAAAPILAALAGALILWRLVDRFIRARPAERLLIGPVAGTSAAAVGLAAVGFTVGAVFGGAAVVAIRAISVAVAVALIGVALAVSWEIVRVATARRRSARLVSDLSTAAGPGRLRKELAAITHDDSLDILFPLTDRVVDFSGRTITDPRLDGDDRTRRISVAIGEDGGEVAVLTHRAGLLDDSGFRDAVARAAGLALEHERLQAELISRMADLRQSRADLVASFDGERRRLERDLHDGAQQQVVALLLQLRLANTRHPDPNLEEAIVEVLAALDDLRRLAHGLFPAALAEDGLVAALDELREGAAIPIRLTGVLEHRLPLDVETTAYVVVAETLQRGRLDAVDVDVSAADGIAAITVTGVRRAADERTGPRDGVVGLADRVGAIGGWLHIDDRADALTVRAELPCVS